MQVSSGARRFLISHAAIAEGWATMEEEPDPEKFHVGEK